MSFMNDHHRSARADAARDVLYRTLVCFNTATKEIVTGG